MNNQKWAEAVLVVTVVASAAFASAGDWLFRSPASPGGGDASEWPVTDSLTPAVAVSPVVAASPAPSEAPAPAPEPCADAHDSLGALSMHSTPMRSGACVVSINRDQNARQQRRNFSANSSGSLMVYNEFGAGPNSTATGARVFFVFPRLGNPRFLRFSHGEIGLQLASGVQISFSSFDGRVVGMQGGEITEARDFVVSNNGGVELSAMQTLWLDVGFKLGGPAYTLPARKSVFHDPLGNTCELENRKIFTYGGGDPRLTHATDSELAAFLAVACQQLDTSSLRR